MSDPQSSGHSNRKESARTITSKLVTSSKRWDWEPDTDIVYPLKPTPGQKIQSFDSGSVSSMLEARTEPGWRLKDILMAAHLLKNPPDKDNCYDDEAEMRRVYGLVYDVLRCRLYMVFLKFVTL